MEAQESNLPQVTQLVNVETWVWIQTHLDPKPRFLPLHHILSPLRKLPWVESEKGEIQQKVHKQQSGKGKSRNALTEANRKEPFK